MSSVSKRRKDCSRTKIKSMGDHKEFLKRITKTLYYGQLPTLPCLSLPVTEISCEVWSAVQRGRSLRRLHADAAAGLARSACVSPCALVLALLYLERLHACNPDYLTRATPHDLFLVSLMVGNKFLQDDGEDDEVLCSEWATSGGIDLKQLKRLEVEFLNAIDWKVFVSESSFEAGLSWLEERVAERQGRLRGFYTYTDLAALEACGAAAAGAARGALAAVLALALAYMAAVGALLAAALLASRAATLAPTSRAALSSLTTSLGPGPASSPSGFVNNASVEFPPVLDVLGDAEVEIDVDTEPRVSWCARWARPSAAATRRRSPAAAAAEADRSWLEPWWARASVLDWLYQSASIDPLQRWLEQRAGLPGAAPPDARAERSCVRQWLNLSRLGALMASVSDR